MNNNTETEELLTHQKHQLIDAKKTEVLLLESSTVSQSAFNDLKKNLGWNDVDLEQESKLRSTLELIKANTEHINDKILSEEAIALYCIKNNYVLCPITQYKGKIPDELLEAIDKYSKENNVRLESDANKSNLFLLCRFSDTIQGKAKNAKRSKRYGNGLYPKLLMLEKLDNGNKYSNNYYKIIFEQGYKTPITNFLWSLFRTHTKQGNFAVNLALVFMIPVIIMLGAIITILVSKEPVYWVMEPCRLMIAIPLVIMFIKSIVPIILGSQPDNLSVNLFNDEGYRYTSSRYFRWFSTSFNNTMIGQMLQESKLVKRALIIKNQMSYYLYMGVALLLVSGLLWTARIVNINKHERIVVTHSQKPIVVVENAGTKNAKAVKKCQADITIFKKVTPFKYTDWRGVITH